MAAKRTSRLELLGLAAGRANDLASVVGKHEILLGKIMRETGIGNVLYGIEDPTQKVQVLEAASTADLTLTQTAQSITGDGDSSKVRLLLPTIGDWLIEATVALIVDATNPGTLKGELFVNDSGSAESGIAQFKPDSTETATVSMRWKVTTTTINTPVELKAWKDNAGGTARALVTHTRITAIGGGGSADIRLSNHGLLEGLGDISDHAYATLIDGSRAFTGEQSMGTNKLTSVVDPTSDQDAATKKYHDDNKYLDSEAIAAVEGEGTLDLGGAVTMASTLNVASWLTVPADGITLFPPTIDDALAFFYTVVGQSDPRMTLTHDRLAFGSGGSAADTVLRRRMANVFEILAGDSLEVDVL
ncbi:hypothetical protein LCGC14_2637970, partial [marine sediment metagenome]